MKEKLKEYAYKSPLLDEDGICFILNYNACGNDIKLHAIVNLFEKMIEKHFKIIYIQMAYGIAVYYYV